MKLRSAAVVAGLVLGSMSGAVEASPITYFDSVIGSGSLGTTAFTNEVITVSFSGDTNNVYFDSQQKVYFNNIGIGKVAVDGIGAALLLSKISVFSSVSNSVAGITASNTDILDTSNEFFATYKLGYVDPHSGLAIFNPGESFQTSLGNLQITAVSGDSTFYTSTVPLPAAAPMFGAALLALGAVGYGLKRKRTAAAA